MIKTPEVFRKGEKIFLERFKEVHREIPPSLTHKEAKEKIETTIEKLKEEIKNLPSVKREISIHPNIPVSQISNILAQAIQIALDEDPTKALEFIYKTGNPFLVDAFHDLLIGYYLGVLQQRGKIKIEE